MYRHKSDNKYIASASNDNTIRIWSLVEYKQEAVLLNHKNKVKSVAITNDDRYLISGSYDKTIILWNLIDKCFEMKLEGHTDKIQSVAFSSNNILILSGSTDKTLRIWNLEEFFLEKNTKIDDKILENADCLEKSENFCKNTKTWDSEDEKMKLALENLNKKTYFQMSFDDKKMINSL